MTAPRVKIRTEFAEAQEFTEVFSATVNSESERATKLLRQVDRDHDWHHDSDRTVTRATSDGVVVPPRTLAMPSSLKIVMPAVIAASRMSVALACD